ncbi:MAG TPA: hypothetical protein VHS31_18385 [Tepidisphaeraceae bacterium]|nr:hypothetical protein [Tepidisphaeraceae bacterium]
MNLRSPNFSFLVLSFLICAGCASHAHAAAATQPVDHSIPVATIKLADAIDLDKLAGDAEPDMSHQLRLTRGGRIYFGTLSTFDNDDQPTSSVPIIARKHGEDWQAIAIRDNRLKNASWAYVGGGPNRGEVWGVLDAGLDDDQPDLLIAHSTDGGDTFSLRALHKPDPAADFDSFCIGPDHNGRITIYLDAENASNSSKPGYYHFRTTDGGQSWSVPDYEADTMHPARDVPDEDQPSTPTAPSRKVSFKKIPARLTPSPCNQREGSSPLQSRLHPTEKISATLSLDTGRASQSLATTKS